MERVVDEVEEEEEEEEEGAEVKNEVEEEAEDEVGCGGECVMTVAVTRRGMAGDFVVG